MSSKITPFEVPDPPILNRNFRDEYNRLLRNVNAVNHGEFEFTVNELLEQAYVVDEESSDRATPLAIQRCRRGGKTFMLHAVAAMLSDDPRFLKSNPTTYIIFISMNSDTIYTFEDENNDAYNAILSRVAWELSGRESDFDLFCRKYNNYDTVHTWLTSSGNQVILIVDELNVIPPDSKQYRTMSRLLNNLMQKNGCAILYSTHLRSTSDFLRGRVPGTQRTLALSMREHQWVSIPRIVNEKCLHGLRKNTNHQPSFWCSVLRGRIPALVLQKYSSIQNYASNVFQDELNPGAERQKCLAAVMTGCIDDLPNERNLFRAYSYMSERFKKKTQPLFAWPPFMVAQEEVLGKDYELLRVPLENPDIDKPKAFEALVQLAVLLRLLSEQQHDLVPSNKAIQTGSAFDATEMFHVGDTVTTLEGIIEEVDYQYSNKPGVVQVVAVPMYASFPLYDFFILHKQGLTWTVAAGYQCKQGADDPTEDAWTSQVLMSVWIEGKCRQYRVQDGRGRVRAQQIERRGWIMLGKSNQQELLGVSISEALPQDPDYSDPNRSICEAETSRKRPLEMEIVDSEGNSKAKHIRRT